MKRVLVLLSILLSINFLSAQTHGPVIPMDSVQYVDQSTLSSGKSDPIHFKYGDTVTIEGIVAFNQVYYGQSTSRKATWIQDTIFKPFHAMNVFIEPVMPGYSGNLAQLNAEVKFYENFLPGYRVKCTGRVADYTENTQLNLIPIESEIIDIPSKIDTTEVVKPLVLKIDQFMQNDGSGGQNIMRTTGEQYEGYYVKFENVTVVDVSATPGRFYWSVQDSAGNKIQIRDNSGYFRNDHKEDAVWVKNHVFAPPSIGTQLAYIKGIIVQSSSAAGNAFMISPCLPTDYKIASAAPFVESKTRFPVVPNSSQQVKIVAKITDNDGKIANTSLYYSVGYGNKTFTKVNMSQISSTNFFEGYIPPAPNNESVNFWIRAVDDSGLVTNSPDTLATGSLYKVIDGGISKISDIQQTPLANGNSIFNRDTLNGLNIGGIVTATLNQFPFIAIQQGNKPYSAILLKASAGDGLSNLKSGDSITISGCQVLEDFNVTFLTNCGGSNFKLISRNNPIPSAIKIQYPDSVNLKNPAFTELYESMLLEFNDIYITSNNPDAPGGNFGEWSFSNDSNSTSGLRADDLSSFIESNFNTDSLKLHQNLQYLKGLLYYSFGNWKLLPRDKNDIDGYFSDTSTQSIERISDEINLTIFPNPFLNSFTITGKSDISDKIYIQMHDISGKTIISEEYQVNGAFQIPISFDKISKGFYIMKISTDAGYSTSNRLIRIE